MAELVVNEKEFTAKFKVSVQIKGMVLVTVTNLKDNNSFVQSIEGDFAEIMKKNQGEIDGSVVIQNRLVTWELDGSCHFRFGVEQFVKLREYPLDVDNLEVFPVET